MVQDSHPAQVVPCKSILLYGNSILIAGLCKKLENLPGWKISHIAKGEPGDLTHIHVIVTDLRDSNSIKILAAFGNHPGILLVGIDSLSNTLTVFAGQNQPMHSLQDVLDALQQAL